VNKHKSNEIKEYIQVISIQKSKRVQAKKCNIETRSDKSAQGRHGYLYVETEVHIRGLFFFNLRWAIKKRQIDIT